MLQNERFEDWSPTISLLRKTFSTYEETVVNYHAVAAERQSREATPSFRRGVPEEGDVAVPKARISCASRGNFLEVLNMSLNTFENHYLSRNLDRTGQQTIVITPGVGIFQVL